jgi:glycosyltransferase involved in cell wall biosynthesis
MSRGLVHGSGRPTIPNPVTLMSVHQEWHQFSTSDSPYQRVLQQMDWVCCFSQSTFRWLLSQSHGYASELVHRSSIIPHAIPPAAYSSICREISTRAQPIIAFVGRLSREKGADLALRAFSLLRRDSPNLRMIVAGDGQERSSLTALSEELGIADYVTFTGWLSSDEVRATLRSASLLLIPSREESFGLIALEAAHAACPIVATDVGGLPELCIDGQTGLLCPPEDPAALAAAAARLLAAPELSRRLGLAAQTHALASPGWEEHMDAYEALVRRLVAERFVDQDSAGTAPTMSVTP